MNTTPYIGQPVGNMYGNTGYIYQIEDREGPKTFLIGAGLAPITKKISIVYTDRPGFSDISEHELNRYSNWAHGSEPATPEQVAEYVKKAHAHIEQERQARSKAEQAQKESRDQFVATYGPKVPAWAKAVLIAEHRVNESDISTDYFNHSTDAYIVLSFSTHTRDLFPEMRKAASNSPKTAFLTDSPESFEHREKYSMGGGYYLGKYRHSGWCVKKYPLREDSPINSIPTGEWCVPEGKQATITNAANQNGISAHIEQHTHTKKGFLMHMVVLDTRVDRAAFLEYAETAKSLGGWYSKQWGGTPGGFAFLEASQADQFLSMITGSDTPPDSPKPTKGKGEKFRAMADKLTSQIADKMGDRLTNTPKRLAQANHARLEGERLQRTQKVLYKLADLHDAGEVPAILQHISTKSDVYDLVGSKTEQVANGYHSYSVCTGKPRLETPEALAVWSLLDAKTPEQIKAEEIRRKVEGLQFSKIPGYFPTPSEVGERMIALAKLEPFHKVLEPEAGHGANVDLILAAGVPWQNITLVEYNSTLASILAHKYRLVYPGDFLGKTAWELGGPFDRIIMNPPFEKGQDIKHIKHALTMLKPDGILVGICSNGTKQAEALQPLADSWEILPAGTFKESGTNVQSVLLTIKP